MKYRKLQDLQCNILLVISAIAISQALHAQSIVNPYLPQVYTLSVGAGWPINDQSNETLFLETDLEKTYTAAQYHRVPAQGELFIGWQRTLTHQLIGQIGIAGGASTNVSLTGNIWEDANPEFNNFTYGYSLLHSQVMLESILLTSYWQNFMPYLKVGIGAGFNKTQNYTITPIIFEEVPAPPFNGQTTTALTYMVGAGVQKTIHQNWQAGIGYTFSDWGKSQLSKASQETLNNAPSMSHFYVNSLVFHLTYLR